MSMWRVWWSHRFPRLERVLHLVGLFAVTVLKLCIFFFLTRGTAVSSCSRPHKLSFWPSFLVWKLNCDLSTHSMSPISCILRKIVLTVVSVYRDHYFCIFNHFLSFLPLHSWVFSPLMTIVYICMWSLLFLSCLYSVPLINPCARCYALTTQLYDKSWHKPVEDPIFFSHVLVILGPSLVHVSFESSLFIVGIWGELKSFGWFDNLRVD